MYLLNFSFYFLKSYKLIYSHKVVLKKALNICSILFSHMPAMISMIQGIPIPINEYNAIVPESRIPEWFSD